MQKFRKLEKSQNSKKRQDFRISQADFSVWAGRDRNTLSKVEWIANSQRTKATEDAENTEK